MRPVVRHIGHVSPGRYHGHHHVTEACIAVCGVCHRMVIRWSLMGPKDRDAFVTEIRKRMGS